MAHGVRLFGEFYNDQLQPADPFAFTRLLQGAGMRAVKRNRDLAELAAGVRRRPDWQQALATAKDLPSGLVEALRPLADSIGLSLEQSGRLLLELARRDFPQAGGEDPKTLQTEYLAHFGPDRRSWAAELLELGRASYRLRDDDNLSMDRIRRQVKFAEEEGRWRLAVRPNAELAELLKPPSEGMENAGGVASLEQVRVRQIQGQPAGAGVARASARVVAGPQDLADFRAGEVLVCDAIDPAMTFIVPLAAAVVERRGGMLIHGAIIAREYGLPCVTGIRDAADIIRTGDRVTVDGYLGIVIIDRGP
jgi:pyruvate,water dikinase